MNITKAPQYLRKHSQYTNSDYNRLKRLGWKNKDIKTKWDDEAAEGMPPRVHNSMTAENQKKIKGHVDDLKSILKKYSAGSELHTAYGTARETEDDVASVYYYIFNAIDKLESIGAKAARV